MSKHKQKWLMLPSEIRAKRLQNESAVKVLTNNSAEASFLTNLLRIVKSRRKLFDTDEATSTWRVIRTTVTVVTGQSIRVLNYNPQRFAVLFLSLTADPYAIAPWTLANNTDGWTVATGRDSPLVLIRGDLGGAIAESWQVFHTAALPLDIPVVEIVVDKG